MKWFLFILTCATASASPLSVTGTNPRSTEGTLQTTSGTKAVVFVLKSASNTQIGNTGALPSNTVVLPIYAFQSGDTLNSVSYKGSSVAAFNVIEVK